MSQKSQFLQGEGDAWFHRNREAIAHRKLPEDDPILMEILELPGINPGSSRILEIGCGDGSRLEWLMKMGAECYGIDPSAEAISFAKKRGIHAQQGVADALPYGSRSFDIVILGFCLYLCDRDDLFKIAYEVDRVLGASGWILIIDFFSPCPGERPYVHRPGILSYKMDYSALFSWHPHYRCMTQKIRGHADHLTYIDDPEEWMSISVIRKADFAVRS